MDARGIDVLIVPRGDEYLGEYVPPCAERLAWLSGFTGSAGVAVVFANRAVLLTDARYTAQARMQLDADIWQVVDIMETPLADFLAAEGQGGQVVAYDPRVQSAYEVASWQEKVTSQVTWHALESNMIDALWTDRPAPPNAPVSLFPDDVAGASAEEKIKRISAALEKDGVHGAVLAAPDSVAWLLNIRGRDVAHLPVALCRAYLSAAGEVTLFIDKERLPDGLPADTCAPEDMEQALKEIAANTDLPITLDEKRSPRWFKDILQKAGAVVLDKTDPCFWPRACKNASEQEAMRQAHIVDGAALAGFLCWLEGEAPKGHLSELSIAEKIEEFRAAHAAYQEPSFDAIVGYNQNGAIIHYRVTEQTSLPVRGDGLLLVDSGGQYSGEGFCGTTDITRTMAIGQPAQKMREHNTLVLKGHIAVAMAEFPEGTCGAEIDALARAALKERGLNFAHGTGHGVGCYLSVHEASANLSPRGKDALMAGMILSNEPGYYEEGSHGIRIENLVLVEERGSGMLGFETISYAPIDQRLIVADMLTPEEKAWLNEYHAKVREVLSPLLEGDAREWLEQATRFV